MEMSIKTIGFSFKGGLSGPLVPPLAGTTPDDAPLILRIVQATASDGNFALRENYGHFAFVPLQEAFAQEEKTSFVTDQV